MANHYWPTGPAESLRTREFAEEEWSRLVLNAPRDKPSFMASLKEVNDRIIGLKVALPPLQSNVPCQEPPKDYGFVMDSNMRVASTSSLSAARGLRENLSKLLASSHAPPTSSHRRSMEPTISRSTTAHTNFDILSSARRSVFLPDQTAQQPTDHLVSFQDQNESHRQYHLQNHQQRDVETDITQKDLEFAKMLEKFKSSNVAPARQEDLQSSRTETVLGKAEQKSDTHSDVINNMNIQYESEDNSEVEEEEEEEIVEKVTSPLLATSKPASFDTRTPLPLPVSTGLPEDVSAVLTQQPVSTVPVATPTPAAAAAKPTKTAKEAQASVRSDSQSVAAIPATVDNSKINFATAETPPEPAELASFAAKDAGTTRPSDETDQLSRLQAWERELQEREQKVLQYMNSLSRPLGAKKSPKPLSYDDSNDEDVLLERRQDQVRRETPAASALRGSAEIHIHNHITPPAAVAPSAAPVPSRSSYYESSTWQPSAYAPLKNYQTTSVAALPHPAQTHEVVRPPSVQTRVPQRSPYAFPPAPYSSLGSGRGTVDLSGLSLERMRELTGHY